MLNHVENTWQGKNFFTNQGNQFWGQFNGIFSGVITGNVSGVPTLAGNNTFTGVNFSGALSGDVTGHQTSTVVSNVNPAAVAAGTFSSGNFTFIADVTVDGGLSTTSGAIQSGSSLYASSYVQAVTSVSAGTTISAQGNITSQAVIAAVGDIGTSTGDLVATTGTVFATPSGLTGFKAGVAALIALNTSVHVSFNTSVANTNYCVTINPACFGSAPTSTLVVTNLATNGFDIVIGAGGTAISNIAIAWVVWPFNNP